MKRLLLICSLLFSVNFTFAQLQCTGGLSWGTQIGQTGYDLHTSGSSTNRIVRNADGSLSVVWQDHYDELTAGNTPKSIRGLGYNHFDAGTGTWTGGTGAGSGECWQEKNGCASDFVGWPEIINTDAGKEIVLTHYLGNGVPGNSKTTRDIIATGNWNDSELTKIDKAYDINQNIVDSGGTWPRAVSVGETIHMLLAWSSGSGIISFKDTNGINDPFRYYRSQDAGVTWDITNFDFNSRGVTLDSTDITRVGGDSYAIHAKGNTIAITVGAGINNDWLLFKSSDGGDLWTKTLIQNNHLADTSFTAQNGERGFVSNNNDFEIIIDNNGTAHTFASMAWYIDNETIFRPSGEEYRKKGCGMLYWKEGMTSPDTIAFPDYDSDPLGDDEVYDVKQQPYHGHYYLGMPTASVDSDNNLFLIYSAVNENSVAYINPEQQTDTTGFHDLYMISSFDNGENWGEIDYCFGLLTNIGSINIAEEIYGEFGGTPTQDDLFPTTVVDIASDGIIHLTWQGDWDSPGLALRSADYPHASDNCNYITYAKLDVSGLSGKPSKGSINDNNKGTQGVDCTGISKEINKLKISILPNPATSFTIIEADSKINNLSVVDLFGKEVLRYNNIHNSMFKLETQNLQEGMYLIKIETDKGIGTEKLIIKK